jgi:hypothetical protein
MSFRATKEREIHLDVRWQEVVTVDFSAKTPRNDMPEEVEANLTPLLLDICVDGVGLYGETYFQFYRKKHWLPYNKPVYAVTS